MSYRVTYIDNFHVPDPDAFWAGRSFDSYEDAVQHCKEVVDSFLEDCYKPGMSAAQLWQQYTLFGEDACVQSDKGERFSGWDYAKQRCAVVCAQQDAQ